VVGQVLMNEHYMRARMRIIYGVEPAVRPVHVRHAGWPAALGDDAVVWGDSRTRSRGTACW
jgi:hypothetical protein